MAPLKRAPILRQFELIEAVKAYDPTADEALLNRAYVYAMKMHGSQLRASGDPYFAHPSHLFVILSGSIFGPYFLKSLGLQNIVLGLS